MIRKTVPSKSKKYFYYVCSENKNNKTCSSHSISESKLELAVLRALQKHVSMVLSMESILSLAAEIPYKQFETQKIEKQLNKRQSELEKISNKRFMLYDDYKSDIITKDEYAIYKSSYDNDYETISYDITRLEKELAEILNAQNNNDWLEEYKSFANIECLSRKMIVSLVNQILIHENGRIDISFKYQNYFANAINYLDKNNLLKEVCVNG